MVFDFITDHYLDIDVIDYSKPEFYDINGDGLQDLIIGEDFGGLHLFLNTTETSVDPEQTGPENYELLSSYPNPFNPATHILYSLSRPGNVSVKVFNVNGRLVKDLLDGKQIDGSHELVWDGRNQNGEFVASGIYFCRLKTDSEIRTIKMLLQK